MEYTESEKKTFIISSNFEFEVEADTEEEAVESVMDAIADPSIYLEVVEKKKEASNEG